MPHYRKLYVKTIESFDIADMPDDFTRLLWVLLPLKLCREGRGVDRAQWIRSTYFPLRADVTVEQVEAAMNWYAERGMIVCYKVNDRPYFHIPTFHEYQTGTERETPSQYPSPSEATQELLTTNSRVSQEEVTSRSTPAVHASVSVHASESVSIKSAKTRNPSLNQHIAIQAYRETAHQYPKGTWKQKVVDAVGTNAPDVDFWRQVCESYVGLGWNPGNVKGMLEFYERREIPSVNGRKPPVNEPRQHKWHDRPRWEVLQEEALRKEAEKEMGNDKKSIR